MIHPLLEPSRLINMPTPKNSIDGGEAWVIGDYYGLTLNRPIPMYQSIESATGIACAPSIGIEHRTALSVFYKHDRNPHGPSVRPIAVYSVERFVIPSGLNNAAGSGIDGPPGTRGQTEYMMCKYYNGRHSNYGACQGDGSTQSDRDQLMHQFLVDFGLSDRPKLIGSIVDIEGHPETGVPRKTSSSNSEKRGCLPLLALAGLASAALILVSVCVTG
jgi:hypothetical protein